MDHLTNSPENGALTAPPIEWWKSRAVIGALVAVVAAALRIFDVEIGGIQPELTELVFELASLIGGIVAAEGRISATRRIGVERPRSKVEGLDDGRSADQGSTVIDRRYMEKAARGVVTLLVLFAMGLVCLLLTGCSVTGAVFYPLPEGGKATVGFTREMAEPRGYAK